MIALQQEPISPDALIAAVRRDDDGAVALFLGTVRDHNEGRRVLALEYEAFPEMALAEMERLAREARTRFGVERIAIVHRTGELRIGETSVGVAVAAPHRAEAFEACRWLIDTLKQTVPIWKREHFEGGVHWL